jgi:hypothetical protein
MKRFSWIAFVSVTLLHLYVTSLLISAGFSADGAIEHGQPHQSLLWLTVWAWVWQPVEMFCFRCIGVHSTQYLVFVSLFWSIVVGAFFGFLLPRVFRLRRRVV